MLKRKYYTMKDGKKALVGDVELAETVDELMAGTSTAVLAKLFQDSTCRIETLNIIRAQKEHKKST